ncbi:MarR family winged helix-turn-helix transcriptional regulator [Cellulomonas hominis]
MHDLMPDADSHRVLLDAVTQLARVQREIGVALARDLDCPRAGLGLVRILDREGEVAVGEIAQRLRVDISVASRQVTALVEAGLAERRTPEAPGLDRRVRTVRLTDAGTRFVGDCYRRLAHLSATTFATWTPAEITAAADQVLKIAAAIETTHRDYADTPPTDTDTLPELATAGTA